MEEREIGLLAAAAGIVLALALMSGGAPFDASLHLALAPLDLELSARFAGATFELKL